MADVTSYAEQYRAVRQSFGLWRHAGSGFELVGADRVRLLNGLVTCDVNELEPGRGAQGFFTDIKGHVLAEVVVLVDAESLWLWVASSVAEAMADHVGRYIIADRVEVRPPDRPAAVTLLGPAGAARLAGFPGRGEPPKKLWSHRQIEVAGETVRLIVDAHYGAPAISLVGSPTAIDEVVAGLKTPPVGEPPIETPAALVDTIRIEAGIPAFGCDYDSDCLPQETGLVTAIDYDKGCYLGQEVIARLHYRGQVARQVTRLRGDGKRLPEVGAVLELERREAGVLTSVARHPETDEIVALGMLQRRAWAPGTRLEIADNGELWVAAE